MFKDIIDNLENKHNTVYPVILSIALIILIRTLIENFSSHLFGSGFNFFPWSGYLLHLPLFYFCLLFSLVLMFAVLLKKSPYKILYLMVYFIPVILLAPILDLIFSKGQGFLMTYIYVPFNQLIFNFFTLGGSLQEPGITIGIRIEVILILIGIGIYFWQKTKSHFKTVVSIILSYCIIYFYLALPSIILWLNGLDYNTFNSFNFFTDTPNLRLGVGYALSSIETIFNFKMAGILFILAFLLMCLIFWFENKSVFKVIIKNSRLERIVFYISLFLIGGFLAYFFDFNFEFSFFNYVAFIVFIISFYSSWKVAVLVNDLYDQKADSLSNPLRPLVNGDYGARQLKNLTYFFIICSIIGSVILGWQFFILFMSFNAVYYLYSAPPLRLKRILIVNNLMIGLNGLIMVLIGFFFVANTLDLSLFPIKFAGLLLLIFAFSFNLKDIKDYKGDKLDGTKTLVVAFGEKTGRLIISLLVIISFLLVAVIFNNHELYFISAVFGLIFMVLINQQGVKEKWYFIVYFCYLVILLTVL